MNAHRPGPASGYQHELHGAGGAFRYREIKISVERIAQGLSHPWAIDFLPDGSMIVTERGGKMRIVSKTGGLGEPLEGLPDVDVGGQGGLLDVTLHPNFASNRLVYWSYSEAGRGGNSTAVARGRLSEDGTSLLDVRVIFSQTPKVASRQHFGNRIVFDGKGHLFVTLGERSRESFAVRRRI